VTKKHFSVSPRNAILLIARKISSNIPEEKIVLMHRKVEKKKKRRHRYESKPADLFLQQKAANAKSAFLRSDVGSAKWPEGKN